MRLNKEDEAFLKEIISKKEALEGKKTAFTSDLELRVARLEGTVAALMTHVPELAKEFEELENVVFEIKKEAENVH